MISTFVLFVMAIIVIAGCVSKSLALKNKSPTGRRATNDHASKLETLPALQDARSQVSGRLSAGSR
jgi:hypothetical protein